MSAGGPPAAAWPAPEEVRALLVEVANEELLPRFQARGGGSVKSDGSVVTEADLAVQRRLGAALQARWPDYALLGEEMPAGEQQAVMGRAGAGLWCLDPLDGTSNFAAGLPFFAVSLALLAGGETRLGWVYDPVRAECFVARRGGGAWLNGQALAPPPAPALADSLAVVDFKRLAPPLARRLVECPPYRSQRSFGSVALDWAWLAAGRYQVYVHGRQSPWDYAAGELILAEAGGTSSTLSGDAVRASRLEPCSVAAARDAGLHREWLDWLAGAG